MSDTPSAPVPSPPKNKSLAVWLALAGAGTAACLLLSCGIGGLSYFGNPLAADAFDPNDFARTKRWALANSRRLDGLYENKIAMTDAIGKFNEDIKQHVGVKVRWNMPAK